MHKQRPANRQRTQRYECYTLRKGGGGGLGGVYPAYICTTGGSRSQAAIQYCSAVSQQKSSVSADIREGYYTIGQITCLAHPVAHRNHRIYYPPPPPHPDFMNSFTIPSASVAFKFEDTPLTTQSRRRRDPSLCLGFLPWPKAVHDAPNTVYPSA